MPAITPEALAGLRCRESRLLYVSFKATAVSGGSGSR